MKQSFLRQFLSAVVLTLCLGGIANAQFEIDFTNSILAEADPAVSTGDLIDRSPFTIGDMPATFAVLEDPNRTLGITIESITSSFNSNNPNSVITTAVTENAGTQFGINSSFEFNTSRIDAIFNESITFSFTEAVTITSLRVDNLTDPNEQVTFGTQSFTSLDTQNGLPDNSFDFTFDGTSTGLVLAADEQITLSVQGLNGRIGAEAELVGIVLASPASVPEPSSIALLGLLSIGAVARRRRYEH